MIKLKITKPVNKDIKTGCSFIFHAIVFFIFGYFIIDTQTIDVRPGGTFHITKEVAYLFGGSIIVFGIYLAINGIMSFVKIQKKTD